MSVVGVFGTTATAGPGAAPGVMGTSGTVLNPGDGAMAVAAGGVAVAGGVAGREAGGGVVVVAAAGGAAVGGVTGDNWAEVVVVEWEKAIRISKKVEKRGVLDILIFVCLCVDEYNDVGIKRIVHFWCEENGEQGLGFI